MDVPSNQLDIVTWIHCGKCLAEIPPDTSPREWAQLEVGNTMKGIQVWCRRHNCNVVNIDFQGAEHPVNFTAKEET